MPVYFFLRVACGLEVSAGLSGCGSAAAVAWAVDRAAAHANEKASRPRNVPPGRGRPAVGRWLILASPRCPRAVPGACPAGGERLRCCTSVAGRCKRRGRSTSQSERPAAASLQQFPAPQGRSGSACRRGARPSRTCRRPCGPTPGAPGKDSPSRETWPLRAARRPSRARLSSDSTALVVSPMTSAVSASFPAWPGRATRRWPTSPSRSGRSGGRSGRKSRGCWAAGRRHADRSAPSDDN